MTFQTNFVSRFCRTQNRGLFSAAYKFERGDRVLLEPVKSSLGRLLSKPLRNRAKTQVHQGAILHDNIIGKHPRDTVFADNDKPYRLIVPSLDDYIRLTPRRVTPIYPSNASIIVSALDIHLSSADKGDVFEVLEVGTGHGALTLFLARAVHAANPPTPEDRRTESTNYDLERTTVLGESGVWADSGANGLSTLPFTDWNTKRKAVIHTLDISLQNSLHAQNILRGFRQGMYAGNVDFHVGDIRKWVPEQLEARSSNSKSSQFGDKTFLAHIIFDIPDCHLNLTEAAAVLRTDGKLAVFGPSITQIVACVEKIKEENLPLIMETVLELGPSISGGREWDVRASFPKSEQRTDGKAYRDDGNSAEELQKENLCGNNFVDGRRWNMVCRPRVGARTFNGGFLGVWKKMQR